jgi:hypothetical protein
MTKNYNCFPGQGTHEVGCNHPKPPLPSWEEKFEKKHWGAMFEDGDYNSLIADIRTLLATQKEALAEKVTRFEVIDYTKANKDVARVLVKYDVKVELSYQDDDRTLKVFLSDQEPINNKPEWQH